MNYLKSYWLSKRVFDFLLALIGMMFFIPLSICFGFLVWLEDGGHIFYFQDRVGKEGIIFKGIKFRSMYPGAEEGLGPVQAKDNDSRVTKVGRFLRKTAMDELPQLINILKGDMSFVGPRALRPIEIESDNKLMAESIFQIPGFEKRSSVRPGLTGTAQVFASRSLLRQDKFKYDLWYIENMNLWLDIKLITKSVLVTLKGKWDI